MTVYTPLLPPLVFTLKHVTCHALSRKISKMIISKQSFSNLSNEIGRVLVTRVLGNNL